MEILRSLLERRPEPRARASRRGAGCAPCAESSRHWPSAATISTAAPLQSPRGEAHDAVRSPWNSLNSLKSLIIYDINEAFCGVIKAFKGQKWHEMTVTRLAQIAVHQLQHLSSQRAPLGRQGVGRCGAGRRSPPRLGTYIHRKIDQVKSKYL